MPDNLLNSGEIRDLVPVNGAINPVVVDRAPMGGSPSVNQREQAGLLDYWLMIRRHKIAVAFATLLGFGIGFLLTLPEPRIYQARTTIEIQSLNDEFLNM